VLFLETQQPKGSKRAAFGKKTYRAKQEQNTAFFIPGQIINASSSVNGAFLD